MIVVSRFQTAETGFPERARAALDAFAACAGFERGRLGRAADDPTLWTVVTEWKSVGAFRRAPSRRTT
ncbi:antibiotic biosynthesis monooxygenase [Fodinicola feengrottensis]|uniref:antibiotic biosynthesis monooxygenase n=1 Tax=Fodinicola feengrottensis TaxID=435914 RepID=UPI002441FB55|nr:antibiotic biosynthesis monooxygenase [Fodinicola feengrottensis]